MTRDDARKMVADYEKYLRQHLPEVKAYAEGKDIQYLSGDNWVDVSVPSFTSMDTYRAKPEKVRLIGWVCTENYGTWNKGDFRHSEPTSNLDFWKYVDVEV